LLLILLSCLLLPIKHRHCIANAFFLFFGFLSLTLLFSLEIKCPELGVDLLFHNFLVNSSLLVHELLLTLHLALMHKELACFFT